MLMLAKLLMLLLMLCTNASFSGPACQEEAAEEEGVLGFHCVCHPQHPLTHT